MLASVHADGAIASSEALRRCGLKRAARTLASVAICGAVLATLLLGSPGPALAQVTCLGFDATIVGTNGDDKIRGTGGADVIAGLDGDDAIDGMGGDDVICGGAGNDEIKGSGGNDVIDGGAGADQINGGGGDDMIAGGSGDDTVDGSGGNDIVDGGPGMDHVKGGGGDDFVDGGPGLDTVDGGGGFDRCPVSFDIVRECESFEGSGQPVADAGPDQTVPTGATVSLDGSGSSDPNGDALTYSWELTSVPPGSSAVLSDPAAVMPTFVVDQPGTYVAQLTVNDGVLDSDPDTVAISTENSPPVADAGPDQTVFVTDTVFLDGSASSDADGDPLTFFWTFTSRPLDSVAELSDPTAVTPDLVADQPGTYVVQLSVNDGELDGATDSVTITTQNSRPVADAGGDQTVFVADMVTLDGSASSDVDGDLLTFQWSLISVPSGSAALLSDPTAVAPDFVADQPGTYVAQLIVNDGSLDSAADTVTITTQNSPPVANAGPDQSVFVTNMVTLDGSTSSDVDGDPLTFSWSLTSVPLGSAAVLSDPTAVTPDFVADQPGTYVAQLVVNDGALDSAPDTVTITTQNSRPVADAGPDQSVFVTDTVTLDGSGSSDVDGDPLTFQWSLTSLPLGSAASLSDPGAVLPTFVADEPGTYVAQLIVNDGALDSAPVTVTITTQNSPPVANAGPDQSVFVTDSVILDGSASSDVDGDLLAFSWSLTSVPAGSAAALSDPTAVTPDFVADLPGVYVAQLIVNDGSLNSAPDTVTITTQNSRPVADAGPDQTVFVTDLVILDGSGSGDVDGDLLTFSWSLTSVPAGSAATLSDPTAATPDFVADLPGVYVAQLIVNDGLLDSAPDSVTITTQNSRPVADPGMDRLVTVGNTVNLDGSGSSDVDGDSLTFFWSLSSTPLGSTAVISDPAAIAPSFVADVPGTYLVQLIVNDGVLDSDPATVLITAEVPSVLSIDNVSQDEGDSGTSSFGFTVSLSPASTRTVTVDIATLDGLARVADGDYTAIPLSTLTFTPGTTSLAIVVEVNGDARFEPDEDFDVQLSNPVNAEIDPAAGTGTGTILNDDVGVSIANVAQPEGDAGTVSFGFMVNLTGPSDEIITVDYATADGTATLADGDYGAASGTLSFDPGVTSLMASVPVNGDTRDEPDEGFLVSLSNAVNAEILETTAIGTIVNDELQIAISDAALAEGNAGGASFLFTVSLDRTSPLPVSVDFATADNTALLSDNDYVAASGTLTFAPGEVAQTVAVMVNGDTAFEFNETFLVTLSAPVNAAFADSQAVGTITNDDVGIAISNVSRAEGNGANTDFVFTVSLSETHNLPVSVDYTTADGLARVSDNDYIPVTTPMTLTFQPGEVAKDITVQVVGDSVDELIETFSVNLSNPGNASISDAQGVGTILNDDVEVSIADAAMAEGTGGGNTAFAFTVSLSGPHNVPVSVDYVTEDGSATAAGGDYLAITSPVTLTFQPGQVAKQVFVDVVADGDVEPNETFGVRLSNPVNGGIADDQGIGTISNDDVEVSLSSASLFEGDSGTTSCVLTASLSEAHSLPVSVDFATADGSATLADNDYMLTSGTLDFAPGEVAKTVTVPIIGDTTDNTDETFLVTLSNPVNVNLGGNGVCTIVNDDGLASLHLAISDAAIGEGNSGAADVTFTVSLNGPAGNQVTVDYASLDGSATVADNDYLPGSGTLIFEIGETSKLVTVSVLGDSDVEGHETFLVELTNASNATIQDSQGEGVVFNDDVSFSVDDVSVAEGNDGTTNTLATFTVSRTGNTSLTTSVDVDTLDGSARVGTGDYQALSTTLTFLPAETVKQVDVIVLSDVVLENTETFRVQLSNPSNASLGDSLGEATILDDDARFSINDVVIAEGNSGPSDLVFTVSRLGATELTSTVDFTTVNVTASTADDDYLETMGTLTFLPNESVKTISVPVLGDLKSEPDQFFRVDLSNPVNANLGDFQGNGFILNDDVSFAIADAALAEGDSGDTVLRFKVSRFGTTSETTTLDFATQDGTATVAGNDYQTASGSLTFLPADTVKYIDVTVTGDVAFEDPETFRVNISAPAGATVTITDSQATGTIFNDDAQFLINDVALAEGDSGTAGLVFTVSLSGGAPQPASVDFGTRDNTATLADSDYLANAGTLTFAPGETVMTVVVPLVGDTAIEPHEVFHVDLSGPVGASIGDPQGDGTILNDD